MKFTGERMIPEVNTDQPLYVEHINRYLFARKIVKNKIVLDIASGEGYGSDLLLRGGAKKVFGVDISEEAINYSKAKYPGVNFLVGSATTIPLADSSVDIVVSFETIEHITADDQKIFLEEIKRVLKNDGQLMMSTPNINVYPAGNPFHLNELSPEEFMGILKKKFKSVDMYYQENAESNYLSSTEVLKQKKLKDSQDLFDHYKINEINAKASTYIVALCSMRPTDTLKGNVILNNVLPEQKYTFFSRKVASLEIQTESLAKELKTQKEALAIMTSHLNEVRGSLIHTKTHSQGSLFVRLIKKFVPKIIQEKILRPIFDTYNIRKTLNCFMKKPLAFSKHQSPKASIIIPVYNNWLFTYTCLKSLHNLTDTSSFEVIVVDDGSTDRTRQGLEKIKNIVYIKNLKNLGFVGSCNAGAKAAHGEYLVFLNNDTMVKPGWLDSLLLTFTYNNVGLAGSKLVYPDGRLQEAGGIIWKNKNAWNYGRYHDANNYEYNYLKEVDYISGASIMISNKLFNKVGCFGKEFSPGYCEDSDLAFKVREAGFRVIYQPLSEVVHFEGISSGTDISSGMKKHQVENLNTFYKKWKSTLSKENIKETDGPFLARDRSKGKKIMLYVDHQVPRWDQDAGSFITYQYLKIFSELGYKIIFWANDLHKVPDYTEKLQQMGIEVVYGKVSFEEFILKNGKYIETTILSRAPIAIYYIDIVKKYTNSKIHFLTHDLHHIRELRQAKIENDKEMEENAQETKEIELDLMIKSDKTWLVSTEEVDIIKRELPDADTFLYPWVEKEAVPSELISFDQRNGVFFLGGFNHAPNANAVVWFKKEIYPYLKEKDIKVTIVGSNVPEEIKKLEEKDFVIQGFLSDQELDDLFNRSKVFVSPLRYGAGFKGKIAKSLSRGLPVVSTSIGAEGMGLRNGINVFISDDPRQFAENTIKLYTDKKLWNKISSEALRHAKENYSEKNAKKKLSKILS
ncbi:MAG: glycosyltransferase [bacterium]